MNFNDALSIYSQNPTDETKLGIVREFIMTLGAMANRLNAPEPIRCKALSSLFESYTGYLSLHLSEGDLRFYAQQFDDYMEPEEEPAYCEARALKYMQLLFTDKSPSVFLTLAYNLGVGKQQLLEDYKDYVATGKLRTEQMLKQLKEFFEGRS